MILTHMVMFSFFQGGSDNQTLLKLYGGSGIQRAIGTGVHRGVN